MSINPILVVEHDAMQRQLLDLLLAVDAMPLKMVSTAEEALQYLREHTPSAAVFAIDLPDLAGTTLCQKLKGVSRLAGVPVVLIAPEPEGGGPITEAQRREARAVGAELIVQRPLGDKNLRERLQRIMAGTLDPGTTFSGSDLLTFGQSSPPPATTGVGAASELGALRAEVAKLQEANDKLRLRVEKYKRRVVELETALAEERSRPRGLFGRRS
jgi:CheY-like chemotaxis protein